MRLMRDSRVANVVIRSADRAKFLKSPKLH
jgi:hypothetical protein